MNQADIWKLIQKERKTAEEQAEELGMGSHNLEQAILKALKAHAAEARRDGAEREAKVWAGWILSGDALSDVEGKYREWYGDGEFSADDASHFVNRLVYELAKAIEQLGDSDG